MTIQQIKDYIDTDIDIAFDFLDKMFLETKNPEYRDLSKEYLSRPNNFNISDFRSKLKRFVSINYYQEDSIKGDDDFYFNLCKLDFEHQTKYFEAIINSKKALLHFVVRAKEKEFGQEWLVGKLIHHYQRCGSKLHKVEYIGFNNGHDLNWLMNELSNILKIEFRDVKNRIAKFKTKLLFSISKKLETKSQIFVLENAYSFIHSEDFSTFTEICQYLYEGLRNIEPTHKCIFFFLEQETNGQYQCKDYCIDSKSVLVREAKKLDSYKLIDLCITDSISDSIFQSWLDACPEDISDYFEDKKLKKYIGDGNPQTMIHTICKTLGKDYAKYQRIWIK